MRASTFKFLLTILSCALFSLVVNGQTKEGNLLVERADSLVAAGQYAQAIPIYNQFLEQSPNNAALQFKAGTAYLLCPKSINEAIRLLTLAASNGAENMVNYRLAQAHYHNYSFGEAIESLRRFEANGGSPEITDQQAEQLLSWCENGNFLLQFYFQPNILDHKLIGRDQLLNYIPNALQDCEFIAIPATLKTQNDIRMGHEPIVCFPRNPNVGSRVYFSSFGSTDSQNLDIFYTERLPDGFWSNPKNLGDVVNTPYDEDFPYITPDGLTLYFASKGHYSMGGFDIYRSTFDPNSGLWSTPENIGFPYSSPGNDLLFIPNESDKTATFYTNHGTSADSLRVVLVELEMEPIRKAVTSLEPIRAIALLQPVPKPTAGAPQKTTRVTQDKSARFSAVENDPEYARVLAQGFLEQMKSDSLRIHLEKLRDRFDYVTTAEERRKLEAQVVKVEDATLEAQHRADVAFAHVSQIEQEYLVGKRTPPASNHENYAVDNPKYLYQAQFAPTVFQPGELKMLAAAEKNATNLDAQKKELINLRNDILKFEVSDDDESGAAYQKVRNAYLAKITTFNAQFGPYIGLKRDLYSECIAVAMVKQGASDRPEIRSEIDRAKANIRSASAIRNNITGVSANESNFEALLLDNLGVLRYEMVFARLWGLKLFEQQILSTIIRLEQALFQASTTKPIEESRASANVADVNSSRALIEQSQSTLVAEPIKIKPEINSEFAILDRSPYGPENPIPVDEPLPAGVLYKIQLGAFSNPVNVQMFKGVTPISAEKVSGGKVTKYYAGRFSKLATAESALSQLKSNGFKDAFLVAWYGGRSVALSRAQNLESQVEPTPMPTEMQLQQPTASSYTILLGSFKGGLPDNLSQTVRAMAPGKDIARKSDGQGNFIYSVGIFRSIDEANRVRDNMIASGMVGVQIVATQE